MSRLLGYCQTPTVGLQQESKPEMNTSEDRWAIRGVHQNTLQMTMMNKICHTGRLLLKHL